MDNYNDGAMGGQGNNMTQQSVLNAFDFSAIEEMDPSLGKFPRYSLYQLRAMWWHMIARLPSSSVSRILIAVPRRLAHSRPSA